MMLTEPLQSLRQCPSTQVRATAGDRMSKPSHAVTGGTRRSASADVAVAAGARRLTRPVGGHRVEQPWS